MSNRLPLTKAQSSRYGQLKPKPILLPVANPLVPIFDEPVASIDSAGRPTIRMMARGYTAAMQKKKDKQNKAKAEDTANKAVWKKLAPFNNRWAKRPKVPGVGEIVNGVNMNRGMTFCVFCQKKTPNIGPVQFIQDRTRDGKPTRVRLSSECSVCHHKKSDFVKKTTTNVRGSQIGKIGKNANKPFQRHLGGDVV